MSSKWRIISVCVILPRIVIASFWRLYHASLNYEVQLHPGFIVKDRTFISIDWERRIFMDEGREKLIEEIGELALQYDMNYVG